MKYSEFEDVMNHYGYITENKTYDLYVRKVQGNRIVCIDKEDSHAICTDYVEFLELPQDEKNFLLDIFLDLAKTPLEEREEEKRYYLRLATKIDVYEDRRYLNMDIPNEKYTLSENKDDAYYKAIFTESEISKMDITGFQKVEVLG